MKSETVTSPQHRQRSRALAILGVFAVGGPSLAWVLTTGFGLTGLYLDVPLHDEAFFWISMSFMGAALGFLPGLITGLAALWLSKQTRSLSLYALVTIGVAAIAYGVEFWLISGSFSFGVSFGSISALGAALFTYWMTIPVPR